jgi:hypothetical protein
LGADPVKIRLDKEFGGDFGMAGIGAGGDQEVTRQALERAGFDPDCRTL